MSQSQGETESVSSCIKRSAVLFKTKIPSQRLPFKAQISH